ncbi:head-tail connector protein [Paenibacillus oleatilyticus]|uniref:Head-tail connector protein n=1 Tax=Paenibacillus oleatilyticus TaxID=2594886 RepID=A0ABV4V6P9_9BACL
MAILTLDETKTWVRIDGSDEDGIIEIIRGAAETYLGNAVEVVFDETNALAKLYCLVLCADWYENRDLIGQQPSDKVRFTCQSIMAQLQNAYGPPEYKEG